MRATTASVHQSPKLHAPAHDLEQTRDCLCDSSHEWAYSQISARHHPAKPKQDKHLSAHVVLGEERDPDADEANRGVAVENEERRGWNRSRRIRIGVIDGFGRALQSSKLMERTV
jgi:hypothetical protein